MLQTNREEILLIYKFLQSSSYFKFHTYELYNSNLKLRKKRKRKRKNSHFNNWRYGGGSLSTGMSRRIRNKILKSM